MNGGGFFNANFVHSFENFMLFSNFFAMVAIFALGVGLTFTLGTMTGNRKHGWLVLVAMGVMFFVGVLTVWHFETEGNPMFILVGADQAISSQFGCEQSNNN